MRSALSQLFLSYKDGFPWMRRHTKQQQAVCCCCINYGLASLWSQHLLRSSHYLQVPDNILCEHLLCRKQDLIDWHAVSLQHEWQFRHFVICCRNCRGFRRPSTREDLYLRVIKQLPTVLIAKNCVLWAHQKLEHGRAPDVDASTKEKEVNMQTSKLLRMAH